MNGRSGWVGLALVAVVFLTGAVAGIAADRALRPATLEGREGTGSRGPAPERGLRAPRMPRPDAGRMPLLDQLELSDEQRQRVDSILEQRRRQVTALWREHETTFRSAMDSTQQEILSVLTPGQRAEYQERMRETRRRWQGGGGVPRDRRSPGPGVPPGGGR
jgi:Spy/CpxP family protein refolding chaperone